MMPHAPLAYPQPVEAPGEYAAAVRAIVDQAPPFTAEQKRRLRPLLAGTIPAVTVPAVAA